MRRLILSMLVAMCATAMFAQDVQVATLQHGEETQVFWGAAALQQALEKSVDGDVISLSSGTFTSCDIIKGVKIYGAGAFEANTIENKYLTIISGKTTIKDVKGLYIEGVRFSEMLGIGTLENVTLRRCKFTTSLNFINASIIDGNIMQCEIYYLYPDKHSQNLSIINSVFDLKGTNERDAMLTIVNCVQKVHYDVECGEVRDITATYKNSIINNHTTLSTTTYFWTAYSYSYYYNGNTGYSKSTRPSGQTDNCYVLGNTYDHSFDWDSFFKPDTFYELTDEWKSKLKGDDGTEMGIYGGMMPFTPTPSNPQITKKEVAKQSDENGKLSVKITVEAQK